MCCDCGMYVMECLGYVFKYFWIGIWFVCDVYVFMVCVCVCILLLVCIWRVCSTLDLGLAWCATLCALVGDFVLLCADDKPCLVGACAACSGRDAWKFDFVCELCSRDGAALCSWRLAWRSHAVKVL